MAAKFNKLLFVGLGLVVLAVLFLVYKTSKDESIQANGKSTENVLGGTSKLAAPTAAQVGVDAGVTSINSPVVTSTLNPLEKAKSKRRDYLLVVTSNESKTAALSRLRQEMLPGTSPVARDIYVSCMAKPLTEAEFSARFATYQQSRKTLLPIEAEAAKIELRSCLGVDLEIAKSTTTALQELEKLNPIIHRDTTEAFGQVNYQLPINDQTTQLDRLFAASINTQDVLAVAKLGEFLRGLYVGYSKSNALPVVPVYKGAAFNVYIDGVKLDSSQAMAFALSWTLVTCDLGYPCGTNNPEVRFACAYLGVCTTSARELWLTGQSSVVVGNVETMQQFIVQLFRDKTPSRVAFRQ